MSKNATFERDLTVLIVHPSVVLRSGLTALLAKQPNLTVDDADPSADLQGRLKAREPDVVIYGETGAGGIDAVMATLRSSGRSPRLVVMKDGWSAPEMMARISAGASGFVTPHDDLPTLLSAIEQAASSYGLSIGQSATRGIALPETDEADAAPAPLPLTTREIEILRCAAKGITVGETAKLLHVSLSTVKNHRHNIFAKLGVANAAAAVSLAQNRGVL